MREIKFRAWDVKDGSMITNPLDFPELYPTNELMQYTGLKDKNGVEIYDGDVLMIHNPPNQVQRMELICTVKYLPGAWYAIVKKTNIWDHYRVERLGDGHEILLVNIADEKPIQVIGNTFENPNLLETL
jgi:uncharacterized phage protein (TIGR01671 family)